MEFVEFGGTCGIPVATVITPHYNGNLLWSLWSLKEHRRDRIFHLFPLVRECHALRLNILFLRQDPNNSVYLAPLVTEVVSSSILLLISYHTKSFARIVVKTTQLVVC